MFPAGEVSTRMENVVDKPWEEGAIKVIRKVLVVPIYIFMQKTVVYFIYFLK
jgi:hypothetical protein